MSKKHLALAVLVLLIAAWRTVGYHQGDEHFQILEFAGHRLGWVSADQLPWEFHERMRPGLQPLLAYGVTRLVGLFGSPDPFFVAYLLRLLSAALFLVVMTSLYKTYSPAFLIDRHSRWLALLLLFTWCSVYAGVRFSSEAWSGACFALGLLLYPIASPSEAEARPRVPRSEGWSSALGAGMLFGLSFEFRYQLALAVVGFLTWVLVTRKLNYKHLGLLIIGGLIAVGIGTVADRWLYGEWVFAPWNYLYQNLVAGKAAGYGSEPFYAYLPFIFLRGIPPLSILYLATIGYFCYRYRWDPVTWAYLLFFVVHSLLARKDVRFLFPFLPFLPVVIAIGLRDLESRVGIDYLRRGWRKWLSQLLVIVNCALLVGVMLRPLGSHLSVMHYIYQHYASPITLLADGRHVYNHSDLVIDWYQPRAGVTILSDEEAKRASCATAVCLYSEYTRSEPHPPPGMRLVYTTAPGFLDTFDAWGLLRQPRYWYLYESS